MEETYIFCRKVVSLIFFVSLSNLANGLLESIGSEEKVYFLTTGCRMAQYGNTITSRIECGTSLLLF